MTKKPSHIPLFPDSYLADTMHLTTEEHGAYFLLLMAAWRSEDCTLPNDDKRLAALTKMSVQKWRKAAPTLLEFWTIDKGRIYQKRLQKEWNWVREKSQKARDAVAKRKDRKAYERRTDVDTNDGSSDLHLGGGGGSLSKEGVSGPFKIYEGGGQ